MIAVLLGCCLAALPGYYNFLSLTSHGNMQACRIGEERTCIDVNAQRAFPSLVANVPDGYRSIGDLFVLYSDIVFEHGDIQSSVLTTIFHSTHTPRVRHNMSLHFASQAAAEHVLRALTTSPATPGDAHQDLPE